MYIALGVAFMLGGFGFLIRGGRLEDLGGLLFLILGVVLIGLGIRFI